MEAGSQEFYRVLHRTREEDFAELRSYETREDFVTYEPILKEILSLFGQAIKTSLERTMGKYLQSTGGIYRNDVREDWELAKVSKLLAHNNAAERPFAVAKAYLDCFPTMKLSTLANYSLALTNGSHHSAGTIGKRTKTKLRVTKPAGIAVSSPSVLKEAVTKLCGVRVALPGAVTSLLRAKYSVDSIDADTRRQAHNQAELEKKARGHLKKGIKFNNVSPVSYPYKNIYQCVSLTSLICNLLHPQNMEEPLANSKQDLEDEIMALMGNAKMTCYAYLKRQFSAREARAALDKFFYPHIGATFRDRGGKKLKLTPSDGEDKHQYLKCQRSRYRLLYCT